MVDEGQPQDEHPGGGWGQAASSPPPEDAPPAPPPPPPGSVPAPPPHWDQVQPGADRWPGAPVNPPPPPGPPPGGGPPSGGPSLIKRDQDAGPAWDTAQPTWQSQPGWQQPPGANQPTWDSGPSFPLPPGSYPRRRGRAGLITAIVVGAVVVLVAGLAVIGAVAGGGQNGNSTTSGHRAPIDTQALFDPSNPTTVNGRLYHNLAVSQTRTCSSVAPPGFAAFLRTHHCQGVLRSLFVDGPGDIIVAQSVIVLDNHADAEAVEDKANNDSSSEDIYPPSVPLSEVHAYPGGTAQLPPVPSTAGPAGKAQITDPAENKSGAIFGAQIQNQFVTYNYASYDNGQKADTSDERLQRAAGDVRYAVTDPILAISIDQNANDNDTLRVSLKF